MTHKDDLDVLFEVGSIITDSVGKAKIIHITRKSETIIGNWDDSNEHLVPSDSYVFRDIETGKLSFSEIDDFEPYSVIPPLSSCKYRINNNG
jgi:hypothetical protein